MSNYWNFESDFCKEYWYLKHDKYRSFTYNISIG